MSWPPTGFVYGIDVARFRDSNGDGIGDLAGVTDRLEHIRDLGAQWIWLLPIFPSLRRDNGYDVDDHEGIDPRFGDLDDFAALIDGCHRLGISVMLDLVVHHTSDRHRWFLDARRDRGSAHGHYYVWADEPIEIPGDTNVFPGEEDAVWSYDETAAGWYHHQFYAYQPDLNLANEDVAEEVVGIATTWLRRGVDGFRIDAAIPAVNPKPTDGTGVNEKDFYQKLHARLSEVRPDVVLMGEADVPPESMAPLLQSRGMDAVLDFTLNNSLFLALAREDPGPVYDALDRLDRTSRPACRVNFVRNVDELDLQQLHDDERTEVMRAFGPAPDMLLYGRGLRRGWAPMMGTPERFRMTLSLLAALPGVPLIMQGQEIGIGEDLSVEGRDACRPAMQWTAEAGVGFSTRADSPYILPAQREGPFAAARVNVLDQSGDERSHLALARALARTRQASGVDGEIARPVPIPGAGSVVALAAGDTVTLHNLSARPQVVTPLADADVLLAEAWHGDVLGPYGFVWLRTRGEARFARGTS